MYWLFIQYIFDLFVKIPKSLLIKIKTRFNLHQFNQTNLQTLQKSCEYEEQKQSNQVILMEKDIYAVLGIYSAFYMQ